MASKNRSPSRANPSRTKASTHRTIPPLSYLVTPSVKQLSSQDQALRSLLKEPIRFVLATSLTFDDEENMAPVLRPRKRLNETRDQRENRTNVDHISPRWLAQQSRHHPSRGFRNHTGTDCYMNSVLQALLHVPRFVNWLDCEHSNCTADEPGRCVACALRVLSQQYWDTSSRDHEIHDAVRTVMLRMRPAGWNEYGQLDAHDFYIQLVATLQAQLPLDAAVIEALLVFTQSNATACLSCGHTSSTIAADPSLGVYFEDPAPLVELIRGPETLGVDPVPDYRCENCNTRGAERHKRILTPPEILVVQIRRFRYSARSGRPRVLNVDIPFSEKLDLSAHINGRAPLRYRLLAAVHHQGTINHGHYITVARGPSHRWEQINDSFVNSTSKAAALKPKDNFYPYLLFWEREGGPVPENPSRVHDQRFWEDRERDLAEARTATRQNGANRASKKSYRITKSGRGKH